MRGIPYRPVSKGLTQRHDRLILMLVQMFRVLAHQFGLRDRARWERYFSVNELDMASTSPKVRSFVDHLDSSFLKRHLLERNSPTNYIENHFHRWSVAFSQL